MPGTPADRDLPRLVTALRRHAAARRHRHLLLLAGPAGWCRATAGQLVDTADRLWIGTPGDVAGHVLPATRVTTQLGGEWRDVVYDAHAGLDLDALAAAAGTLRGGGLLLLLAPPLATWPTTPDPALARLLNSPATPADATGRFVTRLVGLLPGASGVTLCAEGEPLPTLAPRDDHPTVPPEPDANGCLGDDQRRAVEAVVAAASGPPVVLTADRGRGKSAALGLAAARLLDAGAQRIVVTAPRRAAAAALFRHAAGRLVLRDAQGDLRLAHGGSLEFMAPDRLVQDPPACDLLLVDEAAAIPAPLLARLLDHEYRIAFATTVHGYEGTGRGFALRFRETLQRLAPGWREVVLEAPVRWAGDDPLERWLNRTLLLDAEPTGGAPGPGEAHCTQLDRDALLADEPLLRELFGLLVQAHYRTTPADLRQLLDTPAITLHALHLGSRLAGVAVCVDEGRLDPDTAFAVWAGRRRVRGHLVAQSLASHAGLRDAPRLGYRRVQRIAVHPEARRRGLGRTLLEAVAAGARQAGCDLLATSFGMTPALVDFWRACGYAPARVGLRREAASGAHALMMLQPLTPDGSALTTLASARLGVSLPDLVAGPLADLEAPLVARLQEALPSTLETTGPDAGDWNEAAAFAFAQRGPDAAFAALRRVTRAFVEQHDARSDGVLDALQARFVAALPWPEVAARLGCTGRAAAIARLREGLGAALRRRDDPRLAALIARLEAMQTSPGDTHDGP